MNERLQPALLGGVFIGVLSALPFVNAGNCCCCLWVVAGGVLAAYLRQQNSPFQIGAAEGALVGLMAGAAGGVIASILSIPMQALVGPWQQQVMDRILASNPDVPSQVRDAVERATSPAMRVVGMLVSVVIDVIFGMLGGLLGVAIFKKNTPPPPGTVEVLPPA